MKMSKRSVIHSQNSTLLLYHAPLRHEHQCRRLQRCHWKRCRDYLRRITNVAKVTSCSCLLQCCSVLDLLVHHESNSVNAKSPHTLRTCESGSTDLVWFQLFANDLSDEYLVGSRLCCIHWHRLHFRFVVSLRYSSQTARPGSSTLARPSCIRFDLHTEVQDGCHDAVLPRTLRGDFETARALPSSLAVCLIAIATECRCTKENVPRVAWRVNLSTVK